MKKKVLAMTYSKSKVFAALGGAKDASRATGDEENMLAELMANPEYLRHSSAVINEALKEGFDVLQLPNGDIVTTGTKTIVNTYVWDGQSGRLDKARAATDKPRARKSSKSKVEEEAEE